MDFDLENKKDSDDEIIELTEIIEKGHAASQAANKAAKAESSVDASLSDLGNSGNVPDMTGAEDVDLDALLAQMDSDGGFSELENSMDESESIKNNTDNAQASSSANSFDSLDDLPDLADVDALLSEMDMPPQPGEAKSQVPSEQVSSDEMDDLLGSILNEAPPAAPAQNNAPAQAAQSENFDDIDALFDEVLGDTPLSAAELAQSVVPGGSSTAAPSAAQLAAEVAAELVAPVAPAAPQPAPSVPPAANEAQAQQENANLASASEEKSKASPIPDLSDDLDAILSASELETESASPAPHKESAVETELTAQALAAEVATPVINTDLPFSPTQAIDDARLKSLEERIETLENNMALRFTELQELVNNSSKVSIDECADIRNVLTGYDSKIEMLGTIQQEVDGIGNISAKVEKLEDTMSQVSHLSENLSQFENTLTQISESVDAVTGRNDADSNTENAEQLAQVQTKLAEFESLAGNFASLSEKLNDLENVVTSISEAVETARNASGSTVESSEQLTQIQEKLIEFEGIMGNLATLSEKLDDLENAITHIAEAAEAAHSDSVHAHADEEQLGQIHSKLTEFEGVTENIASLSEKLNVLEATLMQVSEAVEAVGTQNKDEENEGSIDRIAEINGKLEGLESSINEDIAAQILGVNAKLNNLETSLEDMATLYTKVEALERSSATTEEASTDTSDNSEMTEQLTAMSAKLDGLESSVNEDIAAQILGVNAKLSNLETTLEDMATLYTKVESLENASAAEEETPASTSEESEVTEQLTVMGAKLDGLELSLGEAKEREDDLKNVLSSQISKLEDTVATLSQPQTTEGEGVAENVAVNEELNTKIKQLQTALEEAEDRERIHLRSIAQLEEKVLSLGNDIQNFEQNIQNNLEQMAATAAAKVLREEISALLGEGS